MSGFAKFCLITIPVITIFFMWAFKYRNPYKLFFVFGRKGSGKSSYLAKLALKYTKKGWTVYSNAQDLRVRGVRIIHDVSELGDYVPAANSVMLLDEVSLVWDNRNFKSFKDSTKEFFRLQRHYKCVVYLFSQTFDVDKKIRDLADSMYLATQFLGRWSLLRQINKSIVLTDSTADAESRIAENLSFRNIFSWRFTYLPHFQKYFNSFELPERPEIDYIEVPDDVFDEQQKPKPKLTNGLARLRRSIKFPLAEKKKYKPIQNENSSDDDFFSEIEKNVLKSANEPVYESLEDFWRS